MFLEKYVHELDEQLARLIAARDTIAALAGPSVKRKLNIGSTAVPPVAVATAEPVAIEAAVAETPDIVAAPAKRRGRPKGSRNKTTMVRTHRQATPEPRALSSTVPSGPVVVSPAQLAKRREAVAVAPAPAASAPKPEVPGGGLDALIRELTDRRVSTFSPAA